MSKLEDIVNDILDQADQDSQTQLADTTSEIVVIDIDEILDIFGAALVYHEMVSKTKGLGSLAFIYTRLVHPVIAGIFNSGADSDPDKIQQHLRRLTQLRTDEQLGNYVHDTLENRIWELTQTDDRMVNIRTKELLRLCIAVAEIMLVRIRDYALEFAEKLPPLGSAEAVIQIDERCSAQVTPAVNPDSLIVTLTYGWVYL